MALDRCWLPVASIAAIAFVLMAVVVMAASSLARAGGVNFGEDSDTNDGPSYFGFVRDADGSPVPGARVTAAPQAGGSLVTRSNSMGIYKIPGFAKEIDPKTVDISCAKDGYSQANVLRRGQADLKDPVEVDCTLQKQ
jgi:Carboxypeptidase regulatory-like domain